METTGTGTLIQTIFSNINILMDIPTLITFLFHFLLGAITVFLFIQFFFKKELRLFSNIKRPIMIIKSKGNDMELETKLLNETGFFNIEEPSSNPQITTNLNKHSLVIIGWSPQMKDFDKIIEKAESKKIPIIVYAKGMIEGADRAKINDYYLHSLCQTPLRLINDVFGIISTFKHSK